VDRLKQQPKLIDEERKRIRDILDTWKDEVRLPLTEYENAEKARIEGIRKRMQHFHFAESREYLNSIEVQAEIDVITATVIDDSFEEFASEAAIAKDSTLSTLKKLFDVLLDRETKQAELDRLRKEQAEREQAERDERIAREAAAIAKREAEEKHKAALETAKRKEAEAKLKLETETKRLANEARQAAEAAEQRRLADIRAMEEAAAREKARLAREEQARIDAQAQAEAEERARQADKKHRAEIANEAAEALVAHADVEQAAARRIVNSIHKKLIPHVSIKF
jgi:membrane protein involved in colicin uptake